MSSANPSVLTEREYLDFERKSEIRHEYIAGQIFAMSGASMRHNRIAGNVFREISTRFRDKPCSVFMSDMRVKVSATGMYTYPDVVALCDEPRVEDTHLDTLLNPSVIIEVLSESTEKYDRGEKFAHYRRLETLREYVLVSQDKMRVEHFRRGEGEEWVYSAISDSNAVLHLPAIDCHIDLAAIYEKVDFAA